MNKSILKKPGKDLASRLKYAREYRHMSQHELARKLKKPIQPIVISRYENNKHKPSVDTLAQICDVLDVSSEYFLGRINKLK